MLIHINCNKKVCRRANMTFWLYDALLRKLEYSSDLSISSSLQWLPFCFSALPHSTTACFLCLFVCLLLPLVSPLSHTFLTFPPFNKYNIFNISKKLNKPTCWNLMLTPVSSEHLSLKKVFEQIFMFRIVYSKLSFMFQPDLRVNKTTDWKFVFLLTVKVVTIFQQR